jgi:hypothetical protein
MIAEGVVLSKTAAGLYARSVFPQHRDIIDGARSVRRGEPDGFGRGILRRRRAMLALVDDAIADALAHPAPA